MQHQGVLGVQDMRQPPGQPGPVGQQPHRDLSRVGDRAPDSDFYPQVTGPSA